VKRVDCRNFVPVVGNVYCCQSYLLSLIQIDVRLRATSFVMSNREQCFIPPESFYLQLTCPRPPSEGDTVSSASAIITTSDIVEMMEVWRRGEDDVLGVMFATLYIASNCRALSAVQSFIVLRVDKCQEKSSKHRLGIISDVTGSEPTRLMSICGQDLYPTRNPVVGNGVPAE
jgi:hypothetical protein